MIVGNPRIIIYNKTLIDSVVETVLVTWEDFLRVSQKITKDLDGDGQLNQWGAGTPWGDNHFWVL